LEHLETRELLTATFAPEFPLTAALMSTTVPAGDSSTNVNGDLRTTQFSLDVTRSGMIETKSSSYAEILAAGLGETLSPNLQVMSQWWSYNSVYLGLRVVLRFDTSTLPQGATIEGASLRLRGTGRLNATDDPTLALHAVSLSPTQLTNQSLGSIAYANFSPEGQNEILLNPTQVSRRSDGTIELGLKTSFDLNGIAPATNGNNFYSFFFGNTTDPQSCPVLVVNYRRPSGSNTSVPPTFVPDVSVNPSRIAELFDTLLQPWTVHGQPNRPALLLQRGEQLKQIRTELDSLLAQTHDKARQPVDLAWERAQQRWQTLYREFASAENWELLSESSLDRLWNGPRTTIRMSAAHMQGPNVLMVVEGATEEMRLEIQRASRVNPQRTVLPSTVPQFLSVTLDSQAPSGVYQVRLLRANGSVVGTVALQWDQVARRFNLADQTVRYQPAASMSDDGSLSYDALFQMMLQSERTAAERATAAIQQQETISSLGGATVNSPLLDGPWMVAAVEQQRGELLSRVSGLQGEFAFAIDGTEFQRLFYRTFPHWREENRQQTMRNMRLSWRSFDYARSAELTRFHRRIPHYNNDLGTMVAACMDGILAARRGENPSRFLVQAEAIERKSTGILSALGLRYPSVSRVMEGCWRVLNEQAQELLTARSGYQSQVDRQVSRFLLGYNWAGSGAATPSSNHQAETARTHQHNLSVILRSEGIGSPATRAARYVQAYPEARGALTSLLAAQMQQVERELRLFEQVSRDTSIVRLQELSSEMHEQGEVTQRRLLAMNTANLHGAAIDSLPIINAVNQNGQVIRSPEQLRRELVLLWDLHRQTTTARTEILRTFSEHSANLDRAENAGAIANLFLSVKVQLVSMSKTVLADKALAGSDVFESFVIGSLVTTGELAGVVRNETLADGISMGIAVEAMHQAFIRQSSANPAALAFVVGGVVQQVIVDGFRVHLSFDQLNAMNQLSASLHQLNIGIAQRLHLLGAFPSN
jgi:hypothetical protein